MIRIIESRQEDLDALRSLFLKTRRKTFSWLDSSQFILSDFDKATKDEYVFVALVDNLLVGFVSVWTADNFVHHLYVDEKFQHQGIGTKLLDAVLDKFGFPITLKCEQQNTTALHFYRQKGFVEKEKGHSETGEYVLLQLDKKNPTSVHQSGGLQ